MDSCIPWTITDKTINAIMKKNILLFLMMLLPMLANAGTASSSESSLSATDANTRKAKVLVVTTMDGRETRLGLKNTPVFTIEDSYLVYKSDVAEAKFLLDQLHDIKYEDVTPMPGDASGDGVLNKADFDETALYILGTPTDDFVFSNAEVSGDQMVNVTDIVQISNLINHAEKDEKAQTRSAGFDDDSQQEQNAIYNYRNDNQFNAFLNIDVQKITYSQVDALGVEHKYAVVQEVWTPDSVYRIPLEAIDYIGFRAPKTEFKDGVFIIDEKHLPYITDADNSSISFQEGTSADMMPVKGQIVFSDLAVDPFYMGFAGRVVEIEQSTDVIKYICEPVSPGEVYSKCVELVKITSDENDILQVDGTSQTRISRKTRNIGDDGTLTIPTINLSAGIEGVDIEATFTYIFDYFFSVGVTDKDFVSLKVTRESEYSANMDVKLIETEGTSKEMWLPWPIYTLGAGNKLGFSLNAGIFFDRKGSLNLKAKIPYKSTHIDFYSWSSDDGFQHIEYKEGGWSAMKNYITSGEAWNNSEITLNVNGSAAFGPVLEASFQVWKPSFFSIDARAKAGLELSGELSLDIQELITDGFDFYKTASEDMKITTGLKIGGEIGYTIKNKFNKITGADITFFKTERYILPRFTEPKLPDYNSGAWEGGCEPMSFFSQPTNLIFFPGKVGIGVYDANNTCLGYVQSDNWFFGGDEDDWENSWLQCDISQYVKDKPAGSQLQIHPMFDMLGFIDIKGSPKADVTIPQPLALGTAILDMGEGVSQNISITGGWGAYSAFVLDESKCSAEIKQNQDNFYLQVDGLSKGSTTITVKDLRTGDTKEIIVTVSDKITTLQLSSESLSFESSEKSEEITITSNDNWAASSDQSWCTVSPASGTGDGVLNITVQEYSGTESRSATVTVKAGTLTKAVTVTQNGKSQGDSEKNPPAGAEAVDLGLPSGTLWANMNVGASSPEDYGDYFAWGETTPKDIYSWPSYKWCNGSETTMTKYCSNSKYGDNGFTDSKTVLDAKDDAARANWGGDWRMPTDPEFGELIDNTTNEWTTQNGVNGYKFTSKTNGNSIFLPAAGYRWEGWFSYQNAGSKGYYWSSSLNESHMVTARQLIFGNSYVYADFIVRNDGLSVRPVRKK